VSAAVRESDGARAIREAAAAIVRDAWRADAALRGARLTAILWATVELERAERELGVALAVPLRSEAAARDPDLGATVQSSRPFGPPPEPSLLLVEPDTEGRLAALLARHGEGVLAVDVEVDGRIRRLEVTSGRGGRPRRAPSGRRPAAGE
jgi:hypothetical protein